MRNVLLMLLFVWNSIPTYSQNTAQEATALVRKMANELLKRSNMPGMSVAVSKRGKIVFAEGFGYADLGNSFPVTPETRFRTASVAKIITATALGKLVQEGKLN